MKKILIVEDDNLASKLMYDMLKNIYKVSIANSGEQGIELFKKFKPDILITDLIMNKLDGQKMIEIIRLYDKEVKIIVVTSMEIMEDTITETSYKISHCLIKPINKDALLKAIEE